MTMIRQGQTLSVGLVAIMYLQSCIVSDLMIAVLFRCFLDNSERNSCGEHRQIARNPGRGKIRRGGSERQIVRTILVCEASNCSSVGRLLETLPSDAFDPCEAGLPVRSALARRATEIPERNGVQAFSTAAQTNRATGRNESIRQWVRILPRFQTSSPQYASARAR
jgi:hypothetical protein